MFNSKLIYKPWFVIVFMLFNHQTSYYEWNHGQQIEEIQEFVGNIPFELNLMMHICWYKTPCNIHIHLQMVLTMLEYNQISKYAIVWFLNAEDEDISLKSTLQA